MEMSVEKFVSRRMHPVRVTVGLLNRELDGAKGDEVAMDREMLESVINTLEIFIGDYDVNFKKAAGGREKKFVESGNKGPVKV